MLTGLSARTMKAMQDEADAYAADIQALKNGATLKSMGVKGVTVEQAIAQWSKNEQDIRTRLAKEVSK